MSIGNGSRTSRTAWGALAVLLHVAFAVLAVTPPVALCHRADGGTAIEVSAPWALCSCAECEHCLARMNEPKAEASPAASLAPCRCDHEPIRLAAARSSLRRDDGTRDIHPSPAPAAEPFEPSASLRAAALSAPAWAAPPPAASGRDARLRC